MIISHEHRFIFVKSRKTGGTSVEIALSRFAGPDDVVTPITPRDEILRLKSGARCQNFANDPAIEHRYLEELRGGDIAALPRYITEGQKYANHMTIADILRQVDRSVEGYKIVSVERHPYDKAVSLSNFLLGYRGYIAGGDLEASLDGIRAHIDELIASGKMREKIRNWDLYTLDGDYRVDHMLQHQNLQDDFQRLLGALDLPAIGVELPVTKRGVRDRSVPAREVLTSGQRVAIQEICAEEFEFFSYEK